MVESVVGGIAGLILGSQAGSDIPSGPGFDPNQNINTPGFQFRSGTLQRNPEAQGTLDALGLLSLQNSQALGGLISDVQPGFGRLTESQLTGLRNREFQAIGDLRESLARRRVAGSSFGEASLIQAQLAFQQEEEAIRAQSFLQELDMQQRLLQQQFANTQSVLTQQLTQMNIEAQLASDLTQQTNALLAESMRTQQMLAAQSSSGLGAFFEPIASGIGSFFGDLVGGLGSTSPTLVGNYDAGFT